MEEARQEPAKWTTVFKCRMVKPETEKTVRQMIAGADQAQQSSVKAQSLYQTVTWFLTEYKQEQLLAQEEGREPQSLSKILQTVYFKTGKTPSADGTLVCSQIHSLLGRTRFSAYMHQTTFFCAG